MTDQPQPPEPETPGAVFACQRCGEPMPPMEKPLVDLLRTQGGVTLVHDVCPGDEPAPVVASTGRYFEVRCQVVEVTERDDEDPDAVLGNEVVELMSFRDGLRARDLDSAMRPLADALGVKWAQAEKNAKIADSDATGPTVP